MTKTTILLNNECRTCFNASKGWNNLATRTRDCKKQLKTYGELLDEVMKINYKDNTCTELPQFICGHCSRRLKSAHSFIQQALEVNENLLEKLQCLHEKQIDLESCLEIKVEKNKLETKEENLECLLEIPIDIEPCLEIKLESDEQVTKKEQLECLKETQEIKAEFKEQQAKLNFVKDSVLKDVSEALERKSPQNKSDQATTPETEFKTRSAIKQNHTNNDHEADNESMHSEGSDWQENKLKQKNSSLTSDAITNDSFDIAVPCNKCHKIFKNSKLLAVHQRISHIPEEKKCTCHLCGNKFTRYCNMYKHMRTFHGPETVTLVSKRPEEDYIYKCDECPKKYSRKKSLIYHTKLKHTKTELSANNENNKNNHKNNNEKSKLPDKGSLCPICGSSFTSKTQLTVHLRRHTGERPFKCDQCDRAFLLVTQLNSHRRLHTGEKPYKCKMCAKAFRVSDDLRQHMRTHTNVRPHKCTQCERSFKHTQDLKIHLRSHTGERPYSCRVCGDTFQRYNTLRAHRIRMDHVENNSDNNNKLF